MHLAIVTTVFLTAGLRELGVNAEAEPSGICAKGSCIAHLPLDGFQSCGAVTGQGLVFALPERPKPCILPTAQGNETKVNVTLFLPNPLKPSADAVICQKTCFKLCRWLGGDLYHHTSYSSCNKEPEPLSPEECLSAAKQSHWEGTPLLKAPGSSARTTERRAEASWGTLRMECREVTELSVQETLALAEVGAEGDISVTLPGLPKDSSRTCNLSTCVAGAQRVAWNASQFLAWKAYGAAQSHQGRLKGMLLIVDEAEQGLTLDSSLPRAPAYLGLGALLTLEGPAVHLSAHGATLGLHNGFVASLNVGSSGDEPRLKELLSLSLDPENPKFSYEAAMEEERSAREFAKEHKALCKERRKELAFQRSLFLSGAETEAARTLLDRDDIAAELHGDVVRVHKCRKEEVLAVFADHRLPGESECRRLVPVLLASGRFLFIIPGGRDLTPHSPKVPCDGLETAPFKITQTKYSVPGVASFKEEDYVQELRGHAQRHLAFSAPPAYQSRFVHSAALASQLSANFARDSQAQELLELKAVATSNVGEDLEGTFVGIGKLLVSAGKGLGEFEKRSWEGLGKAVAKVEKGIMTPLQHCVVTLVISGCVVLLLLGLAYLFVTRTHHASEHSERAAQPSDDC